MEALALTAAAVAGAESGWLVQPGLGDDIR